MKNLKFSVLLLFIGVFISCTNNDSDCKNTIVNTTSLENEYGCTNTKYEIEIDVSENYMLIQNQLEFSEFVSTNCQLIIDFSTYDLVIGKKGLTTGNNSIAYELLEDCESKNQTLTVTFNQNESTVAPNLTYHALIPKLKNGQELDVKIEVS